MTLYDILVKFHLDPFNAIPPPSATCDARWMHGGRSCSSIRPSSRGGLLSVWRKVVVLVGVGGGWWFSSSAVERRQNRAPGSPEVRVGGPLKLREKEERGGAERDSIPPPLQKEPGRIAHRQCALPASRRMGIFFPIHPRPLFPSSSSSSSSSQTSQSVCQCAASIRASQTSGIF